MFMDCPTTTAKLFPKCMNIEISFEAYSEKRESRKPQFTKHYRGSSMKTKGTNCESYFSLPMYPIQSSDKRRPSIV